MLFTALSFSELQHIFHFVSSNHHLGGVFKVLSYTEHYVKQRNLSAQYGCERKKKLPLFLWPLFLHFFLIPIALWLLL